VKVISPAKTNAEEFSLSHNVYFFTGFPGFIASRILKKLIADQPAANFIFLVRQSEVLLANQRVADMKRSDSSYENKLKVIVGDITEENLGLSADVVEGFKGEVTHVFHLAAVYDLAVRKEIAEKANILGTKNVNRFVRSLPKLQRYIYFSTAYVSGNRVGRILESELDKGQGFKNFYESTKCEAEKLVQQSWDKVPTTIIRPGIVIGDSKTGETSKFDGPYFVLRFLDRFSFLPVPYIGKGQALMNMVPIDYIVNASTHLAHSPTAASKVFHLTNPNPPRAKEVYEKLCKEMLGVTPKYSVPTALVSASLSVSVLRRLIGVPRETLDYFECGGEYDCSQAQQELSSAGITCPNLFGFTNLIVKFYRDHRKDQERLPIVR